MVYTLQVVGAWTTAISLVYTQCLVLPGPTTHWVVYTHWRVGIGVGTHWANEGRAKAEAKPKRVAERSRGL